MVSTISWRDDATTARCPVCSGGGDMSLVATAVGGGRDPVDVSRCRRCGCLHMTGQRTVYTDSEDWIDGYIEAGAGIETIANTVRRGDTGTVRRMLDVGCNYGFAMHIAQFLHGWEVLGVEPTIAGRRGARELGLPILDVYLDETTDVGEPFDLIVASEVVEHVDDPEAFLRTLCGHLTPGGAIVLTTPAAELLSPHHDPDVVLLGLSPGDHHFLLSEAGLDTLLERAGFEYRSIERSSTTLYAVATTSEDALKAALASVPVSQAELLGYYDHAAEHAPAGSALRRGMAVRHLRSVIAYASWDQFDRSRGRLRENLQARYGLDIDDPLGTRQQVEYAGESPPWLAPIAHALGTAALVRDDDHERAAQYYRLALVAIKHGEARNLLDGEHVMLRMVSRGHLAATLARTDPSRAAEQIAILAGVVGPDDAGRLLVDRWRARTFVTLVVGGHYPEADPLVADVAAAASTLADSADPELRVTGLDALYALGIHALNTGDATAAAGWFGQCEQCALERPATDAHAASLAAVAAEHLAIAWSRLPENGAPIAGQRFAAPAPPVRYGLDAYWCDPYGLYLRGWAHCAPDQVTSVTLRVGDRCATQVPTERPDLAAFWPEHADAVTRAGFALHVPGNPQPSVELELNTPNGLRRITVDLPAHPLPEPASLRTNSDVEQAKDRLGEAPPGPVLAIGLRDIDDGELTKATERLAPRKLINLDIHPGPGVHVVGDAHRLSRFLRHGSFAAAMSGSVLEHLVAPWLMAAEMNRVLMPGGLALHVAPFAWPEHSQPNDFWRFSTAGLAELFGPRTGFEVVDAGVWEMTMIVPGLSWRGPFLDMPTLPSPSTTWILSRKVRELGPDDVRWPYDSSDERVARNYPVDALARWTQR